MLGTPLPQAPLPLSIPAGATYVVPANTQMVSVIAIEVDGDLIIDGVLAEI